jgi:hypothetical protein
VNTPGTPRWLDVELEISGPDKDGFFTCNVAWLLMLEDAPVDYTPFKSYSYDRAVAYALRALADRLIWRSYNHGKPELMKIGPTELG